jgi:uncharacterized hydantoinase/oxoprolinase family protein
VADAQIERIVTAVRRVIERHPTLMTGVVTGLGAFIAERAVERAGLDLVRLADSFGRDGARSAPATSVALLLDAVLDAHR